MLSTPFRWISAALLVTIIPLFALGQDGSTLQERLGYPATARLLMIHADDFGMSNSVNRATEEALERGWINSASIMVPCPWFPEVVRFARARPSLDLGIHLTLNSEWTGYRWGPVSSTDKVPSLLDEQGYLPLLETSVPEKAKIPEVRTEVRAQIDRARNSGIHISHLDAHMTALVLSTPLLQTYLDLGRQYGLPVLLEKTGTRIVRPGVAVPQGEIILDKVVEMDPGIAANDWQNWYKKKLSQLKPGVYQLTVHLGFDDEEMRGATWDHPDWGAAWRQSDFDMVRSPQFRQFLREQKFILVSWRDLARALPPDSRLGPVTPMAPE